MFGIDPILRRDSIPIFENPSVIVLLMDDARFPWTVLVPKVENVIELSDLADQAFVEMMLLARNLGAEMRQVFDADKVNIASIGNIVSQLHIHIVARRKDDVAWPAPIWGYGTPVSMSKDMRELRTVRLQRCDTLKNL